MATVITFIKHRDLSSEERDDLWNKGVNLDDWDFMIVAPPDTTDDLDILFGYGYFDYEWYEVEFRGEMRRLGLRYHA